MGLCLCVKLVLSSAHICSTALPPTLSCPTLLSQPPLFLLLQLWHIHLSPNARLDPLAASIGSLCQSGWQTRRRLSNREAFLRSMPEALHLLSFCWGISTCIQHHSCHAATHLKLQICFFLNTMIVHWNHNSYKIVSSVVWKCAKASFWQILKLPQSVTLVVIHWWHSISTMLTCNERW